MIQSLWMHTDFLLYAHSYSKFRGLSTIDLDTTTGTRLGLVGDGPCEGCIGPLRNHVTTDEKLSVPVKKAPLSPGFVTTDEMENCLFQLFQSCTQYNAYQLRLGIPLTCGYEARVMDIFSYRNVHTPLSQLPVSFQIEKSDPSGREIWAGYECAS